MSSFNTDATVYYEMAIIINAWPPTEGWGFRVHMHMCFYTVFLALACIFLETGSYCIRC